MFTCVSHTYVMAVNSKVEHQSVATFLHPYNNAGDHLKMESGVKAVSSLSLEARIRYQVACEEKAHRIVEQLLENPITEEVLVHVGQYITPSHYHDVTEERAIAKLCGYPLCDKKLTKVLNQKYHISTKENKVYDITDRKNFCSDVCYKASNFYESQIVSSPLWSRKDERPPVITLLPEHMNRGLSGKEVIYRHTDFQKEEKSSIKEDSIQTYKDKDDEKKLNMKHLTISEKCDSSVKSFSTSSGGNEDRKTTQKTPSQCDINSSDKSLSSSMLDDSNAKIQKLMSLLDKKKHLLGKLIQDETVAEKVDSRVNDKYATNMTNVIELDSDEDTDDERGSEPKHDLVTELPTHYKGCTVNKVVNKDSETLMSSKTGNNLENTEDVKVEMKAPTSCVSLICQCMKEWITQETIEYLEVNSTEKLSDKKYPAQMTPAMQSKYQELCRKVDQQELDLEDVMGETQMNDPDVAHSAVPDYRKLKQETGEFSSKVQQFLKGKNIFEKEEKCMTPVYLPSIDTYDQMLIRQKIVMEQLNKVIPELLTPLKLSIQDVFTELKHLVMTFRLNSQNILYKPSEWTLVGLVLLRLLSRKDLQISCAFLNPSAVHFFSVFLGGINETLESVDKFIADILHQ